MTVEALLGVAERLLASDSRWFTGWPRISALLMRAALESIVVSYWDRVGADVASASMSHQLIVLRAYAYEDTAAAARSTWYGLSRAAHHHAYDLAPTAAELLAWLGSVRKVSEQLT
jgi:hypothetical protein